MLSGLRARLVFQITQEKGNPVLLGQAAQLLVEQELQVIQLVILPRFEVGHFRHLPFSGLPLRCGRPRLQRRLVRHPMQPVDDHFSGHDGSRLADEDEEGSLEGVLGVVVVVEDPAAHSPHHRTMALHEDC